LDDNDSEDEGSWRDLSTFDPLSLEYKLLHNAYCRMTYKIDCFWLHWIQHISLCSSDIQPKLSPLLTECLPCHIDPGTPIMTSPVKHHDNTGTSSDTKDFFTLLKRLQQIKTDLAHLSDKDN
jgi:hypothetical protein